LTQQDLANAFSAEEKVAPATVSSWESLGSPKLPPPHRLRAYARFFCTPRSVAEGPRLLALEELTSDEKAVYSRLETELLRLRNDATGNSAEEEIAFSRSWHFTDTGPITLVCAELPEDQKGPLAKPSDPNFTALHAFADADSLIELFGHVRAENPLLNAHFRIPAKVEPDDLTGHVILIGGVVWNEITGWLSDMARLPVKQVIDRKFQSGDPFVAEVDGKDHEFLPRWMDREGGILAEDVGLLVRVPNPLNSSRTLTICNGVHSKGVYGAVRTLTDARLRDVNERYISVHFGGSGSFAILMSVKVIRDTVITPDFSSDGVVLYEWPQGTRA
jgi:hypothetical protein